MKMKMVIQESDCSFVYMRITIDEANVKTNDCEIEGQHFGGVGERMRERETWQVDFQ